MSTQNIVHKYEVRQINEDTMQTVSIREWKLGGDIQTGQYK